MTKTDQLKADIDVALDKLTKIENYCKSYNRQMLTPERLALLTSALFNEQ